MRSEAVVTGAIQITPDGLPLVLFVDRPTTGGYPVIATVISADLPALGQVRARETVRFEWVTRAEARDASEELEQLIGSVPRPRPTTHGTRGRAS
jgi:allophanate hydrolase subunit 2